MAKFFLDTGILLGYIRGADFAKYVEKKFELTSPINISLISIVTIGEIYSLAAQFQWGDKRKKILQKTLETVQIVNVQYYTESRSKKGTSKNAAILIMKNYGRTSSFK